MAAGWARNEVTAEARRCGMIVKYLDPSGLLVMAPPGTDFMAAGVVFVCGVTSPNFALALGTMTNQRQPLVVASDLVESVDTGADTLELTAHDYQTGDGPFDSDEVMGPIAIGDDFWVRKIDDDNIAIYTTLADAYADTNRVALAGTETGATISVSASTERGVWGHFIYEATQGETDHGAPETIVIVDGIVDGLDFRRMNDAGAYTTNGMETAADAWGAVEIEDGVTRDQTLRLLLRGEAAPFTKVGNVITHRDLADTKDSHHGTITASGRSDTEIDDPD
jgi:hypothetical protein